MSKNRQTVRRLPKFELIAGNLCLDFINTLNNRPSGKPEELLKDFCVLARFGEDTGILTPAQSDYFLKHVRRMPEEAKDAVRRARKLREALYAIFSAAMNKQTAPQLALDLLNANIHEAALHSRVVQGERRLEWRFDDMAISCNSMLWLIARAAADLLASSDLALVRACSSPACQWLFFDTSKNHHRRWCDMKVCGNRAKVRKFYAKKKSA